MHNRKETNKKIIRKAVWNYGFPCMIRKINKTNNKPLTYLERQIETHTHTPKPSSLFLDALCFVVGMHNTLLSLWFLSRRFPFSGENASVFLSAPTGSKSQSNSVDIISVSTGINFIYFTEVYNIIFKNFGHISNLGRWVLVYYTGDTSANTTGTWIYATPLG